MKKNLLLLALLPLQMISVAQVPKPGKPAFIVTYEESGKNANASWKYSATVKFSLSASNGWFYVNESGIPDFTKLIDFDPARFLKLEPESVIGFYPSEVDESGSGGAADAASYTRVLTPDGTETLVENTSEGTKTIITTEADIRRRYGMTTDGSAYYFNARSYQIAGQLAELERTETGAILRAYTSVGDNLGEWGVSQETMEQVFPKVVTFVLTDQDIKVWQQISRTNVASGSGEDEHLTVKLSVKMEVPDLEKPEVTLEGCSDLGIGELGQLTALGKPEGGSYRYWAEPSDFLTLQADGPSATLKGASPGRTTVFVEYTSPEGATVQKTRNGACLEVDSYNGGEAIPQIVFYDLYGKRLPGILKIPVDMQPSDAGDLLRFISADPGIITVMGLGSEVNVQGIREGNTTFQAMSPCGATIGPVVEIEVVNCTDETKASIAEEEKAAAELLKEKINQLNDLIQSEEFKNSTNRTAESAASLALKTSALIFGTVGGTPVAEATVQAASKVFGVGSNLVDIFKGGDFSEQAMNAVQMAIELFGKYEIQAVAGAYETIEAASQFGKDLGGLEVALSSLRDHYNDLNHFQDDLNRLIIRKRLCEGGTEQPPGQQESKSKSTREPANQTPPAEDAPKTREPSNQEIPVEKPQAEEPDAEEPPAGEAPGKGDETPPTPPGSGSQQVGLPAIPGECGCNNKTTTVADQNTFSILQSGVKNLGECVENFSNGPLADYSKTLEEWKVVNDNLGAALKAGSAALQKVARDAIPVMEALLGRTKSFDEAGKAFLGEFEKCPESVSAGMDVLKSAMTVTVDSIKTKY